MTSTSWRASASPRRLRPSPNPSLRPRLLVRPLLFPLVPLLLAGCAGLSPDAGFGPVGELTRERTGQTPLLLRTDDETRQARARAEALLNEPLTAERAVEVAFLNQPGLQARFAALGIADAERARAGRPRNPMLGFSRLSEGGGAVEIERSVVFDVLGLLTLPLTRGLEERRLGQLQLEAAQQAVDLAARTRAAWVRAVASQQLVAYAEQVQGAADAASELARRMRDAGNVSLLAQLREQSFGADAGARLRLARHEADRERERLVRLLGVAGTAPLRLPEHLPPLPDAPLASGPAEQAAMDLRLDVRQSRQSSEALAESLGLTRTTRFINVLELGYANRSETGSPRANGYTVSLELPLFDGGTALVARADASYRQALLQTAQVAVEAQSEVREAQLAYHAAHDLARHYRDTVVPLRQRIAAENLLRYNGMQIGVFDLLADARDQADSVTGAIGALRDFWLADTTLHAALAGPVPAL